MELVNLEKGVEADTGEAAGADEEADAAAPRAHLNPDRFDRNVSSVRLPSFGGAMS